MTERTQHILFLVVGAVLVVSGTVQLMLDATAARLDGLGVAASVVMIAAGIFSLAVAVILWRRARSKR